MAPEAAGDGFAVGTDEVDFGIVPPVPPAADRQPPTASVSGQSVFGGNRNTD